MSNIMSTAEVPVHLGEAITMDIEELKKIIDGKAPSSMVLTRSNTKILKQVLLYRSEGKFDYGAFLVYENDEDEDEWPHIMMNDLIKSPRYWSESDFQELRN